MDGVEIYLRPNGDRLLLNIYIPKSLKRSFLKSLEAGSFESAEIPMAFEAHVLPEWSAEGTDGPTGHIRLTVDAINLTVSD